jgi:integrase
VKTTHGFGRVEAVRNGHRGVIYIQGRRHRSPVCPSKALAERWLEEMRFRKVEIIAGSRAPRGTAEDVTFGDVAKEVMDHLEARRTYTVKTMREYRSEMKVLLEIVGKDRKVATMREREVDALVRKLRADGKSTSRIRHLLDRLSQVFAHCVRQQYLGRSPCPKLERPRLVQVTVRDAISGRDLARLAKAAWADQDRRAPAVVLIPARAGLRASEIVQLRTGDVNLERGYIRVEVRGERSDRTKTGKAWTVPIEHADLRRALRAIPAPPESRVGNGGLSYPTSPRLLGILSPDGLDTILRRVARRAGVWEVSLHVLRHTYATLEAARNVPVPLIQRRMGHASIATTMRYVHIQEPSDASPRRARIARSVPRRTAHVKRKCARKRGTAR